MLDNFENMSDNKILISSLDEIAKLRICKSLKPYFLSLNMLNLWNESLNLDI